MCIGGKTGGGGGGEPHHHCEPSVIIDISISIIINKTKINKLNAYDKFHKLHK